jgi:putative ABC transport system substrate-binding protein
MSKGRRRFLFAACACLAGARIAHGQLVRRVGFLGISSPTQALQGVLAEFRDGMAALGWQEGKNYVRVERWAHSRMERLPALAAELIGMQPDLLIAGATESALALKEATRAIPIVAIGTSDPVDLGLTKSLSRPSLNVTGPSFAFPELLDKQMEVLRQAFPRATRVAALRQREMAASEDRVGRLREKAKALGVSMALHDVSGPPDFEPAFRSMQSAGTEVVLVVGSGFMFAHRERLAQLALQHRLPSVWNIPAQADAGGLIAYGVDVRALWRRGAVFADRILRGAKPADLPFERPDKFELVINLTTAKALGVAIPQALLVRADRLIDVGR